MNHDGAEDYTEMGEVTIDTVRRMFGPYPVDRGTYKDLLSQWDTTLETDIITLCEGDNERNYRVQDVTAINWKPANG